MARRTDSRQHDELHTHELSSIAQRDWLSRLLSEVARRAALRPERTLLAALILTAVAGWLAVTQLEFRTSRLDLLSDSAGYNQRWLNYLSRFGHDDDAVIVVSHPDPQRVAQTLTDIGQRLESDSELTGVLYRKSVGKVADKALHLMPASELAQLDQLLLACSNILTSSQATRGVVQAGGTLQADADGDNPIAPHAMGMLTQLSAAVLQAQAGLEHLREAVPHEGPLLLEDEGRLGLCLVRLPHADDKPQESQALLGRLNAHLENFRKQDAEVQLWLTGMPVLEWDESQSSQRDMQRATLLSLLGVAIIFGFGFGSWRMPCAAVACLMIGLVWTVGLATVFIGHLNLFSVAFGAIIAGLGIDYAIHILARVHGQVEFGLSRDLPQLMAEAIAECGKGVFTGAITTGAAFSVAMLTPFRGMTELGLICAMGTVSCMIVSIWILPAFIVLQDRWLPAEKANGAREGTVAKFYKSLQQWLSTINNTILRRRVAVLTVVCAATLWTGMHVGHLRYDHNLLNLQADDVPSVHAERELTRRSGQSAWFAISLAKSPQQALAMHKRLSSLPSVARVEDIGSVIASARTNPQTGQLVATCHDHAVQLLNQIAFLDQQPPPLLQPGGPNLVRTVSHTSTPAVVLSSAAQMHALARSVAQIAAADAPALSDFPSAVRQRMASQDGETYLLRIFARENLWQRENLGQFVSELESVDPRVTGHPIQTWYASGELENSYYQAGIYALLAVMALLMIDLGSIRLVLLALLPVALSSIQLAGLLVWLGIPFNAANMIVLPLILGIGVDDGLHIVHDFHARGDRRFRISTNTTLAVLLTSLTTMVGFGSMGIADHRGLQSLGIVLLLGVGLCLLNSWFTLPALLSYFGPQHTRSTPGNTSSGASLVPTTQSAVGTDANYPAVDRSSADLSGSVGPTARLLLQEIPIVLSLPNYRDA